LFGYLSFFDWRLILIIEYSDIFKASFAALGLLTIFILMAYAGIWGLVWLGLRSDRDIVAVCKWALRMSITFVTLGAVSLSVGVVLSSSRWAWVGLGYWSTSALIFAGVQITMIVMKLPNVGINQLVQNTIFVVLTTMLLGVTFAHMTHDGNNFWRDVVLKNEKLENVGLVMITSHHTILYDKGSIIVPTAEIIKIARPTLKIWCAAAEAC